MLKAAASVVAVLLFVALVCAEPRQGLQKQVAQKQLRSGAAAAAPNHPYLFLTVPRENGNGHEVQGFKVVEIEDDDDEEEAAHKKTKVENNADSNDDAEDDDEEDEANNANAANDDIDDEDDDIVRNNNVEVNDDDDDDFEYNANDDDDVDNLNDENDVTNNLVYLRSRAPHSPRLRSQLKNQAAVISTNGNPASQLSAQLILKNAKPTNMMVSREHAGAIMVPDGIIEIEGQSVVDEKTGKTALLVPRAALDAIPNGSVVALMEGGETDSEEARANRVLVRRRRKGSRRNVVRRGGGKTRRRRGGNRRRRVSNKRKNIRVYQVGGGANRRRGNRRVARPVVLQG